MPGCILTRHKVTGYINLPTFMSLGAFLPKPFISFLNGAKKTCRCLATLLNSEYMETLGYAYADI